MSVMGKGLGLTKNKRLRVSGYIYLSNKIPTMWRAYSFRYLNKNYVGSPVVRVRRNLDNAEADFTSSEITDGTLTTWVGANNGYIVTWYDQMSNQNLFQGTASVQFQIVSSGTLITKNSLPSAYSAESNYMNMGTMATATFSLIEVKETLDTKWADPVSGLSNFGMTASISDPSSPPYSNYGSPLLYVNAGLVSSPTRNDVYTSVATGSLVLQVTQNASTLGWFSGTSRIGAYPAGSGFGFTGYFSEIIIMNTDISSFRSTIEDDLNTYFTIY